MFHLYKRFVALCLGLSEQTTFCKSTVSGVEFMGNLRETRSGNICQSWSSQKPNAHNFTQNSMFPDGSALQASNRCRNPNTTKSDGPWCYTTNPAVPWEYCTVPMCPGMYTFPCSSLCTNFHGQKQGCNYGGVLGVRTPSK